MGSAGTARRAVSSFACAKAKSRQASSCASRFIRSYHLKKKTMPRGTVPQNRWSLMSLTSVYTTAAARRGWTPFGSSISASSLGTLSPRSILTTTFSASRSARRETSSLHWPYVRFRTCNRARLLQKSRLERSTKRRNRVGRKVKFRIMTASYGEPTVGPPRT